MENSIVFFILLIVVMSGIAPVFATIANYQLTENDMEWCEEVYPQYKAAGLDWYLKNYHYSIKARVCGNLYEDPIWEYNGDDRIQKLLERSKYYVNLEIQESEKEAQTGRIDPKPASISEIKANTMMKTSSDGTIGVTIETAKAVTGKDLGFTIIFRDLNQKLIENVNYDLRVTQDEKEVLLLKAQHSDTGTAEHLTRPLSSDSAVDIEVTILGIGMPKDRETWSGPYGDVVSFSAVPEFGPMILVVLVMSVMTVIALTTKYRQNQKF